MLKRWIGVWLVAGAATLTANDGQASTSRPCRGHGIELQVLGSGGPELSDHRASSGYLVWMDGTPKVLVDAGGGTALRFAEVGAHVASLEAVAISHLHIDHVGDLPALMKMGYFEDRTRPLPIFGPGGNQRAPSTSELIRKLFDPASGAFRYLGLFLQGESGGFRLEAHDVSPRGLAVRVVLNRVDLELAAVRVTHGDIPALAWRVRSGGSSIVFSGDTSGLDGSLEKLAESADLLVMHNAIPEESGGGLRWLHMPPSIIGSIAHNAGAKRVVLSHRMNRTLGVEEKTERVIRTQYAGPLAFADDLDCFGVASGNAQ